MSQDKELSRRARRLMREALVDGRRLMRVTLAMLEAALTPCNAARTRLTVASSGRSVRLAVETDAADGGCAPMAAVTARALDLAAALAQAMDGRLQMQGLLGVAFRPDAALPFVEIEPAPNAQRAKQPRPADHPSLRILAVDAPPGNRRLIAMMLETLGCEAILAADGAAALAALAAWRVDLVLTDTMMPPPDGLKITRLIRAASAPWSGV